MAGYFLGCFPAYQQKNRPAIPMSLVQAEIALSSGKKLRIVSDNTWKTHASPNTLLGYWEAHHFEGECYDAALEKMGGILRILMIPVGLWQRFILLTL